MKIALCDDNKEIIEKFKGVLQDIINKESLEISIRTFSSGENLLFELDENINEFDILYLDIEMGNINGIETAEVLRKKGCQSIIIFLTDNEKYVFQSFDVFPLHYILKSDITYEKFKEILFRAMEHKKKKDDEVFLCEFQDVKKIIPLNQIQYFDVQNRIITVHYIDGEFSFYSKLDKIHEELKGKWFIRIHRSFIVNLHFVDRIVMKSLYLTTEEELPIGTTYLKTLKEAFSDYLLEMV